MTRRIATLLLLVLVLGPALALAQPVEELVRGEPDLEVAVASNRFTPGETGEFVVDVLNEGTVNRTTDESLNDRVTAARAVAVRLRTFDAPVTVETEERGLGTIGDGDSATAAFTLRVDDDAEAGRYFMSVRVTYTYTEVIFSNGTYVDDTDRDTFFVSLVVDERAQFRVERVETALAVGESGAIRVTMRNVGSGLARDASVEVVSTNEEFTFAGADRAASFGGDWRPGETRSFVYRAEVAPDAPRRSYAIEATVRYEDEDGIPQASDPVRFGVVPRAERTFAVENVTSTLRVGQEGTVAGVLRNTGDLSAEYVVVRFDTANPNVTPVEVEFAAGTLTPGEAVAFAFDVEVSDAADAGPRQFALVVSYRDRDGDRRAVDPIAVRIEVRPLRKEFLVEPLDATFTAGEEGELRLRVTNARNETLRDVSAKLFPEAPLSSSDDEAFVAALEPGESAEISFRIAVSTSAIEKAYPAGLDFRYEDSEGDTRLSSTYRVPVTVVAPVGSDLPWGLLLPAAAGLLALAVGVSLFRRLRGRGRDRDREPGEEEPTADRPSNAR